MLTVRPVFSALLLIIFIGVFPASAHESRPLYVEISEKAPGRFEVNLRIPPSVLSAGLPSVEMPNVCSPAAPSAGSATVQRRLYSCESDLSGEVVRVTWPRQNPSVSTLFRFERLSGEAHTAIQSPEDLAWQIPDREAAASIGGEYLVLGIEHILFGYDHLLFVACLMLIAGLWRKILFTVTGFTIAHSITLALAALGVVRVPIAPVEAVIALSIVFLAVEIARKRRNTLTWRYPIAVAGSFGLLHGFGFASALKEIGLPQTELPIALLFFNLGVEVGQVVFVLALACAVALVLPRMTALSSNGSFASTAATRRIAVPAAYVVGTLATYWTIERVSGFFV